MRSWCRAAMFLAAISLAVQHTLAADAHAQRGPEAPDVSGELRELARQVRTSPGRLPRLRAKADDETPRLPLEHTHVDADISGPIARVEVTQRYENPYDEPIEAVYKFPLPENSAVDEMRFRIGERVIDAEVRERDEAREAYEQAKKRGQTAALLEQERPNIFTQSVANIAPDAPIEVTIGYVQRLTYHAAAGKHEFVFPMVVGPRFIPGEQNLGRSGTGWSVDTAEVPDASRITPPILGAGQRSGHDVSLEVRLDAGVPVENLDVPTHPVETTNVSDEVVQIELAKRNSLPNRDFVMRYDVAGDEPRAAVLSHADDRGGFFTLLVQPPELDIDELVGRREVVFVVDVSGSMSGVPLGIAKDGVRRAVRRLRPDDTFNVYTFSGRTTRVFDSPRPANTTNIRNALRFVEAARAGGGTHLDDAVRAALSPDIEEERHRYVVFLTDGYVGHERAIFGAAERLVRAYERGGDRARVLGVGIGSSPNRHLLDGLARAGNGTSVYVTNRELPVGALDRLFAAIDHPVMRDVRVDWGELPVDHVYPAGTPDVLATRPLVLEGRYEPPDQGALRETITVHGRAGGRDVDLPVEVALPADADGGDAIATLWARARVGQLRRKLWQGHDSEVVEAITETGLEHELVTSYTSLVAVDRRRSVGDGDPRTVVQPVETPEGVDPTMAAPAHARAGSGGGAAGHGRRIQERTIAGSLARGSIQHTVRNHRQDLQELYEDQLKSQDFSGKVVLRLVIGKQGQVQKAEIARSTLDNDAFEAALLREVRTWHFPAPQGGAKVTVSYPLIFANSDD